MPHREGEQPNGRDITSTLPSAPVVSVIVPVFNVAPYLRQCVDSVLAQSLGLDRLELVAVDDGSTDGSSQILDEYAAQYPAVRVFHEANSGGPGRPRNIGLTQARGVYVFFLDADDYLDTEALERLVAMADRHSSDVVLGRMVGIEGRMLPAKAFRRSCGRAKLTTVYPSSLNALKLFRRALIERLGVRFTEGVKGGEDAPFAAELLLAASTISVVSHPCYYCRSRPGSQTRTRSTEHPADRLGRMAQRAELLAARVPAGRTRELLMARHIRDILRPFGRAWLELDPIERRRMFATGTDLMRRWSSPRILRALSARWAVKAYCLERGMQGAFEDIIATPRSKVYGEPIMSKGRVFANYPHFRDHLKIPDRYFEVTREVKVHQRLDHIAVDDGCLVTSGVAYLPFIGGSTTLVLRRWPLGRSVRYPTAAEPTPLVRDRYRRYPSAGFRVRADLGAVGLSPGPWQIRLEVGSLALHRQVALIAPGGRSSGAPPSPTGSDKSTSTYTLYRAPDHALRLRVPGLSPVRETLERILVGTVIRPRRARPRLDRYVRHWAALGTGARARAMGVRQRRPIAPHR